MHTWDVDLGALVEDGDLLNVEVLDEAVEDTEVRVDTLGVDLVDLLVAALEVLVAALVDVGLLLVAHSWGRASGRSIAGSGSDDGGQDGERGSVEELHFDGLGG